MVSAFRPVSFALTSVGVVIGVEVSQGTLPLEYSVFKPYSTSQAVMVEPPAGSTWPVRLAVVWPIAAGAGG